jgi:hypothetical protein
MRSLLLGPLAAVSLLAVFAACERVDPPTYAENSSGSGGGGGGGGGGGIGGFDGGSSVSDGGVLTIPNAVSRFHVLGDGTLAYLENPSGKGRISLFDPSSGLSGGATGILNVPADFSFVGGVRTNKVWALEAGSGKDGPKITSWIKGTSTSAAALPGAPAAITADARGAYFVTADSDGRAVLRATTDGTNFRELAAVVGGSPVSGAAVVDGFVYWAAVVANQTDVYRSSTDLATGAAEIFATVDGAVSELTASAAGIFVVVPGGSAGGNARGAVLRLPLAGGTGATLLPSEKNPRGLQLLAEGMFAVYTDDGPVRWTTSRSLLPARAFPVAAFAATTTKLFCLGTDGTVRVTNE